MQNFRVLEAPPPDPKNSPPIANSWLRAWPRRSSPLKLPCSGLEDSIIFCIVKILLENARNLAKNLRRHFFVFRNSRSPEKLLLLLLLMGSGASESATVR